MSQIPNDISEWEECPSGRIQDLSHRVRRQSARPKKIAAAVSVVAMLVVGAVLFARPGQQAGPQIRPQSGNMIGGISCKNVAAHAQEYLAGNIDVKLREMITRHLEGCSHCERRFEEMKAKQQGKLLTPETVSFRADPSHSRPTKLHPNHRRFGLAHNAEMVQLGL